MTCLPNAAKINKTLNIIDVNKLYSIRVAEYNKNKS